MEARMNNFGIEQQTLGLTFNFLNSLESRLRFQFVYNCKEGKLLFNPCDVVKLTS